MSWTYLRSEPGLWTVGWYKGDTWEPESDHGSPDEAAERCHYLNGGCSAEDEDDAIAELRAEVSALREQVAQLTGGAA